MTSHSLLIVTLAMHSKKTLREGGREDNQSTDLGEIKMQSCSNRRNKEACRRTFTLAYQS